ncbi:pentatricopeptide repeat-containing protein At5g16860-like [Prosopis cineraria]|uniref:pentatricopeptide repeat-containing protein At5g16860-like n=1 Tax=Prosopis cineraria TaxID=364024 RepID=UPI00240FE4CD|nr:pentatricopeptide repeat-containing protein At5g16860-like [Prosopis cineraria]
MRSCGSIGMGRECFSPMDTYSLTPTSKHYTCMIVLLSRAGKLNGVKKMPKEAHSVTWSSLLGAGRWHDLAQTRQLMKYEGMHKSPECSWTEDRDGVHDFLASDRTNARTEEIYPLEQGVRVISSMRILFSPLWPVHNVLVK